MALVKPIKIEIINHRVALQLVQSVQIEVYSDLLYFFL